MSLLLVAKIIEPSAGSAPAPAAMVVEPGDGNQGVMRDKLLQLFQTALAE